MRWGFPMVAWDERVLNQIGGTADPPADSAVARLVGVGDVQRVADLLTALVESDGVAEARLPPEIGDFVASSVVLPEWAEPERIKRAQWFFQLWGPQITTALACGALPSIFANPRIAKATVIPARDRGNPERWLVQFLQFALDVLSPYGLDGPDADGIAATQSVRLRNAALRQVIRGRAATRPGLWDRAWGHPMNQDDLALVIVTLAGLAGDPLVKLGVPVKTEDSDDFAHLCSVVGALLGVRDELLPTDAASGADLLATLRRRQGAPSDDSREMVGVLLRLLSAAAPVFGGLDVFPALIHHLVGTDLAAALGVPEAVPAVWRVSPRMHRLSTRVRTRMARRRIIERFAEPVGRDLLGGLSDPEGVTQGRPVVIAPQLAKSWDLATAEDSTAAL